MIYSNVVSRLNLKKKFPLSSFNYKNKKGNPKLNGQPCYDALNECDKSVGLYCSGNIGSKTCSCISNQYFNTLNKPANCSRFFFNIKHFL